MRSVPFWKISYISYPDSTLFVFYPPEHTTIAVVILNRTVPTVALYLRLLWNSWRDLALYNISNFRYRARSKRPAWKTFFWHEGSKFIATERSLALHSGFSQNSEKSLLASVTFLCPASCLSACPSAWNNSAPNERIFMKFDIWVFGENLSRKFKFL